MRHIARQKGCFAGPHRHDRSVACLSTDFTFEDMQHLVLAVRDMQRGRPIGWIPVLHHRDRTASVGRCDQYSHECVFEP